MSLFENYEEEYLRCARVLNTHINSISARGVTADRVRTTVVQAEMDVAEAEGYVKAMEVEVRSLRGPVKKSCQQKLERYRNDLGSLKREIERARLTGGGARQAGEVSLAPSQGGMSAQRAQMMLETNDILDESTAQLEQTRRVIADTEQVGDNIMSNLEEQKETLVRAHDDVRETRGITREAQRVLRMMGNRALMHTLCLYVVILILLALIGVVINYGFVNKD
uniref:t-SNARE coiled-coil homology domain-containing protein n=1 Tax=Phaeomonas parva TaxID=124430 RepID=A0A6U4L7W0_9STRA|mmetsp:Transcript_9198/g.26859  ORF Transcript_9198/g.26859 Transcript_9198/m.26859 type:complete len:223 (+) Transcript_9198:276-944(+)|eukprot:CAMPEP_0118852584 /NCGR_PEP_ID=MMETSP1163-20130328/1521_1 /TAXON_ID=124430 /ORGANISM="Phaeomonas parva, Strain CCMP2877" /LENGTH=222 /DNA_ID=CAMNT_0006785023 /DNA_START=1064 /DNA_END=1732 /DNA_ORIENTATION=+